MFRLALDRVQEEVTQQTYLKLSKTNGKLEDKYLVGDKVSVSVEYLPTGRFFKRKAFSSLERSI